MLDSITSILEALWHQDFNALLKPGSDLFIYLFIATLIFLESGFIPAAPFPCDSVIILSGTLAAVNVVEPTVMFGLIVISAAIGSWLAFLQGSWLNRLPFVQNWVNKVSPDKLQTVDKLLSRHGLIALFIARFVPIVRPLLPLMMGMRVKDTSKFHYFSWLSAILWTLMLFGLGYLLPALPKSIGKLVTMLIIIAPLITLCLALLSWLYIKLKLKFKSKT